MFSQAFEAIPNLFGFPGHARFTDYLDDLGNLQGLKDPVNGLNLVLGKVDEPDPRH